MDIEFSVRGPVEASKFACKIFGCRFVVVRCAGVVWEVVSDWLLGYLLFEEIGFVQEQYDRGALKPGKAHN